jgi:hypothetical protein
MAMKPFAIRGVAAGSALWLVLLAATAGAETGRLPRATTDTLPPLRSPHASSSDLVMFDGAGTTVGRAAQPVAISHAAAAIPEPSHQKIDISDSGDEASHGLWLCLAAMAGCAVVAAGLALAKRLWWAKLRQSWTDARQTHRRQRSLQLLQGMIQGEALLQGQQWAGASAEASLLPRATIPFVPRETRAQPQHVFRPLRKAA